MSMLFQNYFHSSTPHLGHCSTGSHRSRQFSISLTLDSLLMIGLSLLSVLFCCF